MDQSQDCVCSIKQFKESAGWCEILKSDETDNGDDDDRDDDDDEAVQVKREKLAAAEVDVTLA